ncbi:hypothetical protein [Nitratireductor sp.]|uniref:hypothetical protein n=1 Tax=Nitratireductor sp. TaxID=1872084 RepID=UPI0025DFD20C|nr:hypothetical protein [Nitratireductor sp.]
MYRLHHLCLPLPVFAFTTAVLAQPEPSFEATCAQLRDRLAALDAQSDEWVTIDVVGELRAVEHDGTLGYMLTCAAPDPEVVCITYEINDYRAGDRVVLSGTLNQIDTDHVSLDPCLHYPADAERPLPFR